MNVNPYQAPCVADGGSRTGLDPKLEKRIDSLYRNAKQLPLLAIFGLFIPVIMLFAAPLGLVYAWQKARLLKLLEGVDLDGGIPIGKVTTAKKIECLTRWNARFYVPSILMAIAIGMVFMAVVQIKDSRKAPSRAQPAPMIRR
jgi:hypothetical protein